MGNSGGRVRVSGDRGKRWELRKGDGRTSNGWKEGWEVGGGGGEKIGDRGREVEGEWRKA